MQLQLTRPMCFFDLETTGVNVTSDRIVEICVHKVHPDGKEETHTWRVNPTVPIPLGASQVHGVYDKDVQDEPIFKELAPTVHALIADSDLAGFNSNKFDIPLLAEEFLRAGIDFEMGKRRAVDVQNIFHRMEQRTLSAAYKFYCNESLENAHSAELENDMNFLADFSNRQKVADFAGFIAFNDEGREIFTFGKYRGQTVKSVLETNPGYFSWIQNADFPLYTKKVLTSIRLKEFGK
jgi:DNA polymerase-3 subunit epsilon